MLRIFDVWSLEFTLGTANVKRTSSAQLVGGCVGKPGNVIGGVYTLEQ
jgi:hypothetical protein